MEALNELEARVGEKWAAAAAVRTPHFDTSEFDMDLGSWGDLPPLPPGTPEFPREQWLTYPNRRVWVLVICNRMLDFEELSDEHWIELCWLMLYGGKTRIS